VHEFLDGGGSRGRYLGVRDFGESSQRHWQSFRRLHLVCERKFSITGRSNPAEFAQSSRASLFIVALYRRSSSSLFIVASPASRLAIATERKAPESLKRIDDFGGSPTCLRGGEDRCSCSFIVPLPPAPTPAPRQ
jgi:hypothetical protein